MEKHRSRNAMARARVTGHLCYHRLVGKDVPLSRVKHGFESRWQYNIRSVSRVGNNLALSLRRSRVRIPYRPQKWPVRLSVRTLGFQPRKRGSTPLRATNIRSIRSTARMLPCHGRDESSILSQTAHKWLVGVTANRLTNLLSRINAIGRGHSLLGENSWLAPSRTEFESPWLHQRYS